MIKSKIEPKMKKGDCEYVIYEFGFDKLCIAITIMVNDKTHKWEIIKIFEPINNIVKVLFRIEYTKDWY